MDYQKKSSSDPFSIQRHNLIEDTQAILIACCFVSFGVFLFKQAGLLTGGTAGLALLFAKISNFSFGQFFFALNLPFYYLAVKRMGVLFTIKTFVSVLLVSLLSDHLHYFIKIQTLNPWFAAILGGWLIGIGMLMLFRHKASLGGINILVSYLQEKFGLSAGKLQMAIDVSILISSFFMMNPQSLLASILGAIAVNIILAVNHKPGRYVGVS